MQSRTFLRIEGDLVSLVTEVIDREVTLPDLLTELTTAQVATTPRLPTGCRFWIRSGTTDRHVFVVEQPPSRRTIEYHASRRRDSEPTTYRLAVPYVVFVVWTIGDQVEGLATYFRTQPIASLEDELLPERARVPEDVGQHRERGLLEEPGRHPHLPFAKGRSHPGEQVARVDHRRAVEVVTKRGHRSHLRPPEEVPGSGPRPPPVPPEWVSRPADP